MELGEEPRPAAWKDASSPLRIIAMFIALSETLASAAAVATDGTARIMLASFAISFPLVVLGVFVWLLVNHTAKLYAPNQYTEITTIGAFAAATSRQSADSQRLMRSAVSQAVATTIGSEEDDDTATNENVVARFVATFDEAVGKASIKIARKAVVGDAEDIYMAVRDQTTVQDLLDFVYFSLAPAVEPYTYGEKWLLVRGDRETLPPMGSNSGKHRDARLLAEVDIHPGITLTAIRR